MDKNKTSFLLSTDALLLLDRLKDRLGLPNGSNVLEVILRDRARQEGINIYAEETEDDEQFGDWG